MAPNHSSSNPCDVNFSVRLFSVTGRTAFSGAPPGILASISSVTVTSAPHEVDQVADHFVGDAARIGADGRRIKVYGAVKALQGRSGRRLFDKGPPSIPGPRGSPKPPPVAGP